VFQIASFILWSLDNYYYYAFCIALISIISIVTTLVETKKVGVDLQERHHLPYVADCWSNERDVAIVLSSGRLSERIL
jgi:cation-transporting ATPase 13A3/4/5